MVGEKRSKKRERDPEREREREKWMSGERENEKRVSEQKFKREMKQRIGEWWERGIGRRNRKIAKSEGERGIEKEF